MKRDHRSPRILSVRPITKEDLAIFHKPAYKPTLQRLRDSHHMVARLAASGLKNYEIADATGYTIERISMLIHDPSMVELIARYRADIDRVWLSGEDGYLAMVRANRNKAERMLSDRLDDADSDESKSLPVRELLSISRDAADRTGFGKIQKNVNINVDFAARLEAARARSAPAAIESRALRRPA